MTSTATPEWLSPYPRTFVEDGVVIGGWADIEPLYQKLLDEEIDSVAALEGWIVKWSEASDIIDEFGSRAYVEMTRHTDDEEKRNAYLAIIQDVQPKATEFEDRLNRKYMDSPYRQELDKDEYRQFDRGVAAAVELFTEKNIPLSVKLAELSQKYQEVSGAMMVHFEGEERTMPQMGVYLRETDRDLRERAYRATYTRRLQEKETFEKIFDEMIRLRHQFARNLNMPDYRAYAFASKLRDYTPDECLVFHDAVEKTFVPLIRKINQRRQETMGVESVKPWDTACDPAGRDPLKPFSGGEELFGGVAAVFTSIDKRLGERFQSLKEMMDLESRKGKAPGGYQTTFAEARIPFIFTNAVGLQDDVNTLLHEGGHAFHTLQCRHQKLHWYRHAAMEFCEVASMSMELLGGERLEPFYDNAVDRERAMTDRLESVVSLFPWVAQIDAFQHWLYTHPEHTAEERAEQWLALSERFGGGVDYSGVPDDARRYQWHRQLHLFEVPFYYIEYAIAQMGALQVWRRYETDPADAVDRYLNALALGGSRGPKELFSAAGGDFDLSEPALNGLCRFVSDKLGLS